MQGNRSAKRYYMYIYIDIYIYTYIRQISPSTIFAVAAILEGCTYINGSPQNTFVPGCVELAIRHKVMIAGDDFKTVCFDDVSLTLLLTLL